MSYLFALLVSILLAIVQSTVTSRIEIFGGSPNLVLLFVVSWVLRRGVREGVALALAGGFALDALSGAPFGLSTLSMLLASLAVGLGESNVFGTAWHLPYVMIVTASLVYNSSLLLLLRMAGRGLPWGPAFARTILPCTILNLVCMPLAYLSLRGLRPATAPDTVSLS